MASISDAPDVASDAKRQASEAVRALTGMAVVELAFHFLDGPADVLRAATTCHRWHELATADSVWRVKARREGMVEKAGVFEVALPAAAGGEGGSSTSTSTSTSTSSTSTSAAAEEEEDKELAGVGLAFYAQVFVLKVGDRVARMGAPPALITTTAHTRCHPHGRATR